MACNRRSFLKSASIGAAAWALSRSAGAETVDTPNFVFVFADDLGYGDLGCYGATDIATPHLDRMAAEGMRFTDFYAAAAVCTPSRAGVMTGCYAPRVGLPDVLHPQAKVGLNADEITLPELLKRQGYATACFGKWHLGHRPEFLPTRHGFDEYFGLPYSNDMGPYSEETKKHPDLPLVEGEETIALNPDQTQLTTWYTEHAVSFIERHKDQPFFVYLPHSMPHIPIHVSDKFKGTSKRGLYGDVIQEIDWSVGQILETLVRLGLDEKTLVCFSSDNGPWRVYGEHGGTAGPLREGKGTSFEGGQREPFIARWPGHVPAGRTCSELGVMFDLYPTFAALAGAEAPGDRVIDGKDIRPLLFGEPNAATPHDAFYYFRSCEIQAVRSGSWKLHVPHKYNHLAVPGAAGKPGSYETQEIGTALFDLSTDIGETRDVAAEHPDIVARLTAMVTAFDAEMKANRRPCGKVRED